MISLDDEQKAWLDQQAALRRVSMASLIRQAVSAFRRREEGWPEGRGRLLPDRRITRDASHVPGGRGESLDGGRTARPSYRPSVMVVVMIVVVVIVIVVVIVLINDFGDDKPLGCV